jgi:hypothetical protein
MVTIVLPLAFSLLLQAGSSSDPLLDLSKNVVGIVRSALDSLQTLTEDVTANVYFSIKASIDGALLPQPSPSPTAKPPNNPDPPFKQKATLYEDDKLDNASKRFVGSVVWRSDIVPVGPQRSPVTTIRADVEIPSRRIGLRLALQRNDDKAMLASHTVELIFTLPPDSPRGGISTIPGVLMQQGESMRGVPLAGRVVKVSNNFFLISLSSTDTEMQRNIQLLKEQSWFVIPFVYADGGRAMITIEKGTTGQRAFADAFVMWADTGAGKNDAPAKGPPQRPQSPQPR